MGELADPCDLGSHAQASEFESRLVHQNAAVVELADTFDLKSNERKLSYRFKPGQRYFICALSIDVERSHHKGCEKSRMDTQKRKWGMTGLLPENAQRLSRWNDAKCNLRRKNNVIE